MTKTVIDPLRLHRRRQALASQALEGLVFSDEDMAFIEAMDRDGLSDDERIARITADILAEVEAIAKSETTAAE